MKKFALIFLTIFLFAGCEQTVNTSPTKTPETPAIEESTGHSDEPLVIKEETETYIVNAEYPKLDYSEKINQIIEERINTDIDLFVEEVDSLELSADEIEEYGYGKSGLWITYEVYLLNDDYISIAFETSIYDSGAAHPNAYIEVFNYDVKNDKELLLLDMFVPDTMFWEAISYAVIQKLKLELDEDEFADDDWIEEGAGPDPQNFNSFTITENSFIFHFPPYQVAAYVAGTQKVEVPFEELGAILMPEWQR